jgi:GNAT superfamily N-acetyltransferase
VARRLLAPPTVRIAGADDAEAIKSFRCGHRPWYVQDAARVIRRVPSVLGTPAAIIHRTRALLFEEEDEEEHRLIAVSVVQQAHDPRTADLVVLAVHEDVQGAWLRERPSRPLCVAVLEETLRFAARDGYQRMLAMAAEQNTKSLRLITRARFVRVTQLDGDYILYQAALPAIEDGLCSTRAV